MSIDICEFVIFQAVLAKVARHRIVVTTCSTAGGLYKLGLPEGHFTHCTNFFFNHILSIYGFSLNLQLVSNISRLLGRSWRNNGAWVDDSNRVVGVSNCFSRRPQAGQISFLWFLSFRILKTYDDLIVFHSWDQFFRVHLPSNMVWSYPSSNVWAWTFYTRGTQSSSSIMVATIRSSSPNSSEITGSIDFVIFICFIFF